MATAAGMLIAYGTLIYALMETENLAPGLMNWFWSRPMVNETAGRVLLWPIMPPDFGGYEGVSLLTEQWKAELISDAVWIVLVPWVFDRLALRWTRKRDRKGR